MDRSAVVWIGAVAGALVSGLALVGLLVGRRRVEPIAIALGLAGGAASAYSLALVGQVYQRPDAIFYAFAFVLAALGGGYALASTLLFRLARRPAPALLRAPGGPADLPPAVIVLCCVEPQHYDPSATAGMLQSLTDEGLLDVSIGGLPFLFFSHKARYRSVGDVSPSLGELREVSERLAASLGASRAAVSWATCSGETRLAKRVAAVVGEGHRRVIIAQLAVAPSIHMNAALEEARALTQGAQDVRLEVAGSVTGSDRLLEMLVRRALDAATGSNGVGLVLVGHGQPEERARRSPQFGEAETVFLSRLRVAAEEHGVPADRIRVAWSEWVEPTITSEVRHLAALGCDHVVVVPAVFPLDTLATRIDLRMGALQARLDDTVAVTVLPAWGADDELVSELAAIVERSTADD